MPYSMASRVELNDVEEQHGLVVVLDALGVKGIQLRRNPQQFIETWMRIISVLRGTDSVLERLVHQGNLPPANRSVMSFSDTIIITVTAENEEDTFRHAIQYIVNTFCFALVHGVMLRGSIALGQFYSSENMIIGPAMDDAIQWHDQLDWIGVAASPSTSSRLDYLKSDGKQVDSLYVDYRVPIKQKPEIRLLKAVNWIPLLEVIDAIENQSLKLHSGGFTTTRERTMKVVRRAFSHSSIPPIAHEKYVKTLEFVEAMLVETIDEGGSTFPATIEPLTD